MPEIDLNELERLEQAATPGPWTGDRYDGTLKYDMTGAEGALVLRVQHKSGEYGFIGDRGGDDEALVMALRNAAPELIRRARKLEKIEAAVEEAQRAKFGGDLPAAVAALCSALEGK